MHRKLFFLLPILLCIPLNTLAQPQTSHFIIGKKSFERSLFSCEDTPGCYEKNNKCDWNISACLQQCNDTAPWNEDTENCRASCMKHSGTLSAFVDYPDIKNSVIESICIHYKEQ